MKGFLFSLAVLPLFLFAQERCATNQIPANQIQLHQEAKFESWLKEKNTFRKLLKSSRQADSGETEQILQIPVVFHVVHNGSPVGEGSNIPDAKILEQLEIINQDFRRQNADTTDTPEAFKPVAADTEIQFVFAKRDPEGIPTNGIVRVQGTELEYTPSTEDDLLKAVSFWPPEDYLNIYITNLSGGNLGYAQFPFANLEGIASELENYRHTDGVVLDYVWVGENLETGGFDSYGRTATHEIGHFLGLRHIWGDNLSNCSVDDFCEDTPETRQPTNGCPADKAFCGSPDMIQNFLDYTDDVCMNLFTICQKERMRTVLEFSPRRKTLLTSPALQEPVLVPNDLGIRTIISPDVAACEGSPTPRIEVRNYGTNEITSYSVELFLNDFLVETVNGSGLLGYLATSEVSFEALTLPADQKNIVRFVVKTVNGGADSNPENNQKTVTLQTGENQLLPFIETFEETSTVYRTTEDGSNSKWTFVTAADSLPGNQAAQLPFFEEDENFGLQDLLLTKVLDLSSLNSAILTFEYSYAAREIPETNGAFYLDGFIVAVSTNCGEDFYVDNFLFERYGEDLSTVPDPVDTSFFPTSFTHWEQAYFDLTNYAGNEYLQVAFIGVNGGGNNLFIDDIQVIPFELPAYDVGIRRLKNFPVVTCDPDVIPELEIRNFGYEEIDEVELTVSVNGQPSSFSYNNLNLDYGFTETFLTDVGQNLQPGANQFTFSIGQVNGNTDEQQANNQVTYQVILDSSTEPIPVKENYENAATWVMTSPTGQSILDTIDLGSNVALQAKAFANGQIGSENYIVSPSLQVGNYTEAALKFKYSYAERVGFNDNLKVLLSFDCGKTFTQEVFNRNTEQLAVTTTNSEWFPESDEDWKTAFIDISQHLIWGDLRIAFVFTNGNGNNLYLDDLEVLTTNDPNLPFFEEERFVVYPNPVNLRDPEDRFIKVFFNLPEKQTVQIRLVDMTGRIVYTDDFPNTVNQTYSFQAPSQSGFYLLQVTGKDVIRYKRLYIRQ